MLGVNVLRMLGVREEPDLRPPLVVGTLGGGAFSVDGRER